MESDVIKVSFREVFRHTYLSILKWLILWFSVVGVVMYVLTPLGIDYHNNYGITAAFFLMSSIAALLHYRIKGVFTHHNRVNQFLGAFLFTVVLVGFGLLVNKYLPISGEKTLQIIESKLVFPLFYFSTWVAKIADVLFQQVFIFIFLKIMKDKGLAEKQNITVFTIVFALLHLPLVIPLGFKALYFIIPSLTAGAMFSYLILYYSYGLCLSYALHMLFYLNLGFFLRYGV